MLDFRRPPTFPTASRYPGLEVETIEAYRHLGLQLDNRLDWSVHANVLYKRKGQCRMYFLGRLASFNICSKLLHMFYQSVVASVSTKKRDTQRLNKIINRADSVEGLQLDTRDTVLEQRTRSKLWAILNTTSHPLHTALRQQRSTFSGRPLTQSCSADRLRISFVPRAVRLYNSLMRRDAGRLRWSPSTFSTCLASVF